MVPADPSIAGWLSIAGDAERDFPSGGTQMFTVNVGVPADARPGTYSFRLDVVSVDNPDEETAQGPSVSVQVAVPGLAPGKIPSWIRYVCPANTTNDISLCVLHASSLHATIVDGGHAMPPHTAAFVSITPPPQELSVATPVAFAVHTLD